jgi:hypothetical protein
VALHAPAPPEELELPALALAAASVPAAAADGVALADGAGVEAAELPDEPALTGFADEVPLEFAALSNELPPQALKVRDVAITITTAHSSAEGR